MSGYIPPYGKRHIPDGSETDKILLKAVDWNVLKNYERFVSKVNERTLFQRGIIKNYDDGGDAALGINVEYFHPSITADDRMVYIMENIVTIPHLKWQNIIGNTIASHFYGARGVHGVLTGITDEKKAHIDFMTLAEEQLAFKKNGKIGPYTLHLRDLAILAKKQKLSVYGTTELHTSLQTAGRRFVNEWYLGDERHVSKGTWSNIAEWLASWVYKPSSYNPKFTVMEGIKNSTNLKEAYNFLTGEKLIGEYYGYHSSTSNSVNPFLNFTHDDTFVAPGPGARQTLERMFPKLSKRKVSYGDRVVWIREKQHQILNLTFHPSLWNYTTKNGVKIFKDPQNELKSYGTEVSLCQFSVYNRLKANPELISRRKIVRVNLNENNKKGKRKVNGTIAKKAFEKQKKKNKSILISSPKPNKSQKIKIKHFSSSHKEKIIVESINRLGLPCTHSAILNDIKSKGLASQFKLDTNWKETWAIMQDLVKKNVLIKEGKKYNVKKKILPANKEIKWATIIPLVGGSAMGCYSATNSKPKFHLSYSAFNKNEKPLMEYWPEVPRINLDEIKNPILENVDFINSVCPCAGLSLLSTAKDRETRDKSNRWMLESADFVLGKVKPKVFWGENAPSLFTKMGTWIREILIKKAQEYGYSFSLYRTSTSYHGIPQNRTRTFYFYWKSEFAPLISYYRRKRKNLPAYLKEIPTWASAQDEFQFKGKIEDNSKTYAFILNKLKISHAEFVKNNDGGSIHSVQTYVAQKGMLDECIEWIQYKFGDSKELNRLKRIKEKINAGGRFMDGSPAYYYDTCNALVGRNLVYITHPSEPRYMSTREIIHLMGMPHDFNFSIKKYNMNLLAQNVPSATARDMTYEVIKFLNNKLEFSNKKILFQDNIKQAIVEK